MKRIGLFTGIVYNNDYDFSNCPECCQIITDEQAEDDAFKIGFKIINSQKCKFCMGCPAANEN